MAYFNEQIPNYYLDEWYCYPNKGQRFQLSYINRGVFVFKCGHRVTHNVFADMVRVKTGVQVYQDTQLQLV